MSEYFYPNKMARIILMGMEETMGPQGVNAALKTASLQHRINNFPPDNLDKQFPFAEFSKMQLALENLYGPRGGRGLALRSGRASFKYGLREFGPMLGCTDPAFRLQPTQDKVRVAIDMIARLLNQFSDQRGQVEELPEQFIWRIERCPVCWGRHADAPVCHMAVGALQESLYWVSGGKHFKIQETECIAQGSQACKMVIDKQPYE